MKEHRFWSQIKSRFRPSYHIILRFIFLNLKIGSQYTSQGPRESFMSYEKYLESLKQMLTLSFQIPLWGLAQIAKTQFRKAAQGRSRYFSTGFSLKCSLLEGPLWTKGSKLWGFFLCVCLLGFFCLLFVLLCSVFNLSPLATRSPS